MRPQHLDLLSSTVLGMIWRRHLSIADVKQMPHNLFKFSVIQYTF